MTVQRQSSSLDFFAVGSPTQHSFNKFNNQTTALLFSSTNPQNNLLQTLFHVRSSLGENGEQTARVFTLVATHTLFPSSLRALTAVTVSADYTAGAAPSASVPIPAVATTD
ncbi:uncharacterized protein LOC128093650 [Culex pipiens pallens]|uniref:uncharacterized protein LOC128093650 n=1 Tax=Culex pipiens pallens TaxID=42434 RepID=UPI0022AA18CD|nr:uncharacterized protein LOC128093650 [Culex pipiens pallens]